MAPELLQSTANGYPNRSNRHNYPNRCRPPPHSDMAPELLQSTAGYDWKQADVWSCGVILYALLCGSLPFDDESIANLFKKIKGGIYVSNESCRSVLLALI